VKEKDDRKKITLFVEPDTHTAAAVKLAQMGGVPAGYSFQSVLEQLLAEWLGGKRQVDAQAAVSSDRYRDDIERLLRVLEKGTAEDRTLIRGLIKRYDDAVQDAQKPVAPNPLRSSKPARDQHRPAR